jgi:hypothetical protein
MSPSQTINGQETFEGPWNPVDVRATAFPPGFVAFASSPGPPGEFYTDDPSTENQKSSRLNTSKKSERIHGSTKEKEKGWEHDVLAKGGLHHVSEVSKGESTKQLGTRTSVLDPCQKEKAHRIRKSSACWACWIAKVPVRLSQHGDIYKR